MVSVVCFLLGLIQGIMLTTKNITAVMVRQHERVLRRSPLTSEVNNNIILVGSAGGLCTKSVDLSGRCDGSGSARR